MHPLLKRQLDELGISPDEPPGEDAWRALLERMGAALHQTSPYAGVVDDLQSKLRALIDVVNDGLCAVDADDRILFANALAEELLGVEADELFGTSLTTHVDVGGDEDRRGRLQARAAATGRSLWLSWRPVSDGGAVVLFEPNQLEGSMSADVDGRLKTVLASAPIVLFSVSASGRLLMAEGNATNAFGIEDDDIDRSVFELWSDRPELLDQLDQALQGVPTTAVLRTGGLTFEVWLTPLATAAGTIQDVVIVATDITVRTRAEQASRDSEARFRGLFEHAADAIFIHDETGRILDVNAQACESLGFERDELLTLHIADVEDEFESDESELWSSITDTTPRTLQGMHKRKDGTVFPVEARIGGYHIGERRLYVALVRDVSERQSQERTLRRLNEQLRVARDEAVEASRAKSAFLANMSHELRTPLNAIIGYSELIQEDIEDYRPEDVRQDIRKIEVAANHLLSIINDILDLSKIEAGKMDLHVERIDLVDLVDSVMTTIQPLADSNNNTLVIDCPPDIGVIHADKTKVRQGLFNLLSNACKFTEEGEVRLKARRRRTQDNEWVLFRVRDDGIGIAPEKLDTLFQAFTQADISTTRKYGGTGLGLAITRHFCRMMGGEISASSELGAGSTFTIQLPTYVQPPAFSGAFDQVPVEMIEESIDESYNESLEDSLARMSESWTSGSGTTPRSELLADPKPIKSPRDLAETVEGSLADLAKLEGGNATVLVIDDDPTVQDLIKRILTKEGFSVHGAFNGRDGLRLARLLEPDVITLDVLMPETDGWSVLSALKADPDLADIPVVMITMVSDRSMGFALGASDFVVKPIQRHRLLSVIDRYRPAKAAPTVLIVEDDDPTRELLHRTLRREGWTIVEASDGRIAVDYLRAYRPDVVLLDLMLPEFDGFQLLETMRATPGWTEIPVVVLTARDLSEEDRARLDGHVQTILQKGSFPRDEFLTQIRSLIGNLIIESRL